MLFAKLRNVIVIEVAYARYLNGINAHILKLRKHIIEILKRVYYRMKVIKSKSELHNHSPNTNSLSP